MRLNLILAFTWLVIGLPLAAVNLTGKEIAGIQPSQYSMLVGTVCLVLAAYNFARWGASRAFSKSKSTPTPIPPRKKPPEGQRFEYNPEFDFSRPGPVTLASEDESPPKSGGTK